MALAPLDLPLQSTSAEYRKFVENVRLAEGECCGALVTSHKASLFDAASDMFGELSPATRRLGEIGMIYWRDGKLVGDANDVISTVEVCRRFLGESPRWKDGSRRALILGGGGAGLALANTLVTDTALGCKSIAISETDQRRAENIRKRVSTWNASIPIEVVNPKETADALVAEVGAGGLIANATGLGKDRPGNPVTESVDFPPQAHIWEFNYRFVMQSQETFMETATKRADQLGLTVIDGWEYFIWGWLVVMATARGLRAVNYYPEFKRIADETRSNFGR